MTILHSLTNEECQTILQTNVHYDSGGEQNEALSRRLVESLTVQEQQVAARCSYAYWVMAIRSTNPLSNEIRIRTAMREAFRHLDGSNDFDVSLRMLKNTIAFRNARNVELYRTCQDYELPDEGVQVADANYDDTDIDASKRCHNIEENMNIHTMVVRGHDKENNAVVLSLPRKEQKNKKGDTEPFLDFLIYMIERAIAYTEVISRGQSDKIVVVADIRDCHPPSIPALKAAISVLQDHYPNRLKTLVVLDPPRWLMGLYSILKKFLDPETAGKVVMVRGEKNRESILRELLDDDQASKFTDEVLSTSVDPNWFSDPVPFHCLPKEVVCSS